MRQARPALLPAIDSESCTGCARCLEVCEPACLTLVWASSRLVRESDCTGCARCARVCPEGWIEMVEARGPGKARAPVGARSEPASTSACAVASASVDELARRLLAELFAGARLARETPLLADFDARRAVELAWGRVAYAVGAGGLDVSFAERLLAEIDELVRTALGSPDDGARPDVAGNPGGLADWLIRLRALSSDVHPSAPELIELCCDGRGEREIAAELGLGLRLTRRIAAHLRAQWIQGAFA